MADVEVAVGFGWEAGAGDGAVVLAVGLELGGGVGGPVEVSGCQGVVVIGRCGGGGGHGVDWLFIFKNGKWE